MSRFGNSHVIERRGDFPELRPVLARIQEVYHPADVLVFGSRARGEATPESDWDIIVVLPDDASPSLLSPDLAWEIRSGSGIPTDIQCCYRHEFLADRSVANSQAREVSGYAVGIGP